MKNFKSKTLKVALLVVGVYLAPSALIASHAGTSDANSVSTAPATAPLSVHQFAKKDGEEISTINQFTEHHVVDRMFRNIAGNFVSQGIVEHPGEFDICSIEPCGFFSEIKRSQTATAALTMAVAESTGAKASSKRDQATVAGITDAQVGAKKDQVTALTPAPSAARAVTTVVCEHPGKITAAAAVVATVAVIAYKHDRCTIS